MLPSPPRVASAWLSVGALWTMLDADARRAERCLSLWLAPAERDLFARMEVPKRRREWLAGRVAAKEVIRRRLGLTGDDALRAIEIVASRDARDKGKPSYRYGGEPGAFDLSITHSHDRAIAALALTTDVRIGIDVEQIETRGESFEELALSAAERAQVSGLAPEARARAVTERWVLKEALSKALGIGLQLRLPRVTVDIEGTRARFQFDDPAESPAELRARLAHLDGACLATVAISRGARV